jgi:SpoVK/Ycf46/Vps4 family AAA+-type ATPase
VSQAHKLIEFGSLPRDPDRDAALVDVRRPERSRDEIVLTPGLKKSLDRIEEEYRARDALARIAVFPKSRLLFVGPPGCGKTLCAEILASDLGLPLLYARFDGIVSSYLGETASNLRRVFNFAAKTRAVLFFDEFDAVGKRRDDDQEVGELKRVVSSFLQILDCYPRDQLVVAATNHHGLLDEALWRRFDEILLFPKPSTAQIVELLQARLGAVRKRSLDLPEVAAAMQGFTFADAERVGHEAIKSMTLAGRKELSQDIILQELANQRARITLASGELPTVEK